MKRMKSLGLFICTATFSLYTMDQKPQGAPTKGGTAINTINSNVVFSPDGKYIAALIDQTVYLWSTQIGTLLYKFSHDTTIISIAFSPDSKYLAICLADKTVRIMNVTSGLLIAKLLSEICLDQVRSGIKAICHFFQKKKSTNLTPTHKRPLLS